MASIKGKRVVVTRPESQSQRFVDLLIGSGAVPILLPVIAISETEDTQALDTVLQRLDQYDWLVLTSVNGVAALWERFDVLGIHRLPQKLKVACIGPKTAAALGEKGHQADYMPTEYLAEAILPGLGELQGLHVLLARAEIARPALPEAIQAGGGIADDISVYRTVPVTPNQQALDALREGADCLTFTSPSTVEHFVLTLQSAGLDPLQLPGDPVTACIGPVTAKAAEQHGFQAAIMPQEYTVEGLTRAIVNYYWKDNNESQHSA